MRFLITGGTGFIGSHLVRALLDRGAERVIVIDDGSSRARHRWEDIRVEYIDGDVAAQRPRALPLVDFVFSLASPVATPDFVRDPARAIRTNVASATLCCEVAARNGAGTLFASSCDAYGEQYPDQLHEDMSSVFRSWRPKRFGYGAAKLAGEMIVLAYAQTGGAGYAVRLFKTFGPRSLAEMPAIFIQKAVEGKPLPVYWPDHVSAPCYVDDIVRGLITFVDRRPQHVGPVNLGGEGPVSVLEFAELVLRVTGSSSAIHIEQPPDDRPDDPPWRVPDLTLARRLLGWAPKIDLEEGIARTAANFRDELPQDRSAAGAAVERS